MPLGERLRAQRAAVGMTQEQVAIGAEMNITQYNGYERGRSRPAPATLARIATALRTTPEALLELEESPATIAAADENVSIRALYHALRSAIAEKLALELDEVIVRIELPVSLGGLKEGAGR